jgi:hypothetical protein
VKGGSNSEGEFVDFSNILERNPATKWCSGFEKNVFHLKKPSSLPDMHFLH